MATITVPAELAGLPAPTIIEEIDFEAILNSRRTSFQSLWTAVRAANPNLDLPEYDVTLLETDSVLILLQEESYREMVVRARVNDAARSNFLAFATGAQLDHLAKFYDVARIEGETDERLKRRVILAIQGRSTGGTRERYMYVAMSASLEVEAVEVYTVGKSPVVNVAVFSTSTNGIASPELLETVRAAISSKSVVMVNDTIVVRSGVLTSVDIEADYWLLPDAPDTMHVAMEANLRSQWDLIQTLGRDLVPNWWISKLMIAGVQNVQAISPVSPVIAPNSEAISIGSVKLNFKGRTF